MEVFGITGQMGCGKSFVRRVLEKHGIPSYDCDSKFKEIVLRFDVIAALSAIDDRLYIMERITRPYNGYRYVWNKPYILEQAKTDERFLPRLEAAFSPFLIDDVQRFIDEQDITGHTIVTIEAATMASSPKLLELIDYVLLVCAPTDVQMRRIKQRDPSRSDEDIKLLLDKQKKSINHPAIFTIFNGDETTEDRIWESFKGEL